MSEVQSRPAAPRGRGSARGGRGGGSSRSTRGGRGHAPNGDKLETPAPISIEDEGEVGQLKKQYGDKVSTIKEMFPDWTDEDIVFALQETDGDLMTTVDRITDGTISQWGEVSKTKKDRSRSKVKDAGLGDSVTQSSRVSRGGRAGFDGGRGGRGRGVDRGRGGRARGPSAAHTNGSRNKENVEPSVPTTESGAWDTTTTPATTDAPSWDTSKPAEEGVSGLGSTVVESASSTAANVTSSIIPDGVKKSWASMFAKPAPVPATKKAPEPVEKYKITSGPQLNLLNIDPRPVETTKPEEPPTVELQAPISQPAPVEPEVSTPVEVAHVEEPEVNITPSKDNLTEDNLEQIPDTSNPAPTATAASTAASSWDPRNASATSTPYSTLQQSQAQAIRPRTSGFQASALKATGSSGRIPSYQRRVLDQEEAVRMPGNREVDRAAVQFGAFSLNGTGDEDVDGEREEPETRAQPPQHSPVAPRAALPPAPQQPVTSAESFPTPKQSAGLPAATHPTAAPGLPSPQPLSGAQSASPQGPQGNAPFNQYGRYGQTGTPEPSSLPQKPYDAFSQQAPSTQSPFEGYPSQQSQSQPQQPSGAFSSAPDQFSSYYTADPQRNAAYNSYYQQQYGLQQGAQGQQDGSAQQRSFSGYNGPQAEGASQFPQSIAQQAPSRYTTTGGDGSGHNTPNPTAQAQQQGASQGAQPQQQPGHPQQPQAGNYPYGHPYYSSPYYAAYMNQYQQYGGGNYGAGPYGGKAGLHQPYQGYGMSPAGAPYEHASSPAAGGFGASSLHGRDSALGGGLGDYGRAGSAQSAQTPQSLAGSGGFGAGHDPFARGSSYPGQNQQQFNSNQANQPGTGDDLKPFSDSKTANGPSPSLSQANRPGSATNTAPGSALPPPQSQQGGYGYPAHLQQQLHNTQASSYGGHGGAGGHQAAGQGHQGSQYGGYQAFGGYNYGNNQQQRGGWGGNYGGH